MSNIDKAVAADGSHTSPRLEPWLVVCLLALLPGALIVVLPAATLLPLLVPICGSMIALIAIGLGMLWRTERKPRNEQARSPGDGHRTADGLEFQ
jgi:hypothetical protein